MSSDEPPPQHPLLGRFFPDAVSLKVAAAAALSAAGRSFKMGRGGSSQKKFICSGRGKVADAGCQSEIRATKQADGEWKVSFVQLEHIGCSGGVAKGKGSTIAGYAAAAIAANLDMKETEMKRSYEQAMGLTSSQRTVSRYTLKAVQAQRSSNAGKIQQAPGYCAELVEHSPGSVASVEVSPKLMALIFGALLCAPCSLETLCCVVRGRVLRVHCVRVCSYDICA